MLVKPVGKLTERSVTHIEKNEAQAIIETKPLTGKARGDEMENVSTAAMSVDDLRDIAGLIV